ncbi:DC-STAMP domain-containing protein 2 [Drosophila persimilis]|uniref:DC-STAMP domain-containing protein 2 n=1 Tax=Drosophila persimilis TaxID=7234 RepID=UPI000F07E423|nr:DC-STAMP domain-containing protein 2 [Drosophila persimilis]
MQHPSLRLQDLNPRWLTIVSLTLLFILLFYGRPVRCILTLAIPSLCSSRGRSCLIALAFLLAAIGPTANILANLKVMLRSLACGQELLRQELGQMMDVLIEPAKSIKMAIDLMLDEMRQALSQVMEPLLRIQDYLIIIIAILKNCLAWLKSIVDMCNEELGTPWGRCKRAALRAMTRCQTKLGIFKPLCHATKLFLALCYPAKIIDVFCSGFWDVNWEMLDKVMEQYHDFLGHIKEMFDDKITFEHDFYFNTNSSKDLLKVGEEIVQDINRLLKPLMLMFGLLDVLCYILVAAVFLKGTYFYIRYMHSLEYKNVFLTESFYAIDIQRQNHGDALLLPLNRLERRKYIRITSPRLTSSECLYIGESSFFMIFTSLQLFSICFLDYSLFWMLATMSYYGHQKSGLEVPAYIDLKIKGGGFLVEIMRGISKGFRPLTQKTVLETSECLPQPVEPNHYRYAEILGLCLFAWLVLLTEPYFLRLRHVIMRCFYPERDHERAMYLHNKILTERISVFKLARRQIRAALMYQDRKGHISSFRGNLNRCCCCACLVGAMSSDICIICAKSLSSSTRINCDSLGCKGVFCPRCFSKSNNKCCLCHRPIDYGDLSDFSVVQDSSDDPDAQSFTQKQARLDCDGYHKKRINI